MPTLISAKQILINNYGFVVNRPAAVLPATATTTYFNINVGQVIITSIFGVVTTATSATATNLTINAVNTAGSITSAIGASTAIASKPVGSILAIPTIGSTLTALAYGVQNNEFVVGAGQIQLVTDATNTGATKWYVNYVPLDPGAYITAA